MTARTKTSQSSKQNNSLVSLKNIIFKYGSRTVLDEVSFDIPEGSLVSIAGKSGSGKSTLLYILGGFLKPKSGSCLFAGKEIYRFGEIGLGGFRKKNIGFLFQDFRLLPFLTLRQNIRFPVLFTGRKVTRNDLDSLMSDLGIEHRQKAYPADISGGEAQRTALGRALVMKPRLLLLDEPTGNLDHETEKEILTILEKLREQGLTLICVTHSQMIMKASDRVFHLENGRLSSEKKRKRRGSA